MLDKSELRQLSRPERARLARDLAEVDEHVLARAARGKWRRRLLIVATLVCALILAAWIGVLAVTLPWRYRAGGWSAAWVGFDVVLLLVFAATAWAAWRRRQILILCLVVLATLLCCDAWFDTTLDWGTRGFMLSLVLALVVELPVALVALVGARRLLRLTVGRMEELEGSTGKVQPFWKLPLFMDESAGYRAILPERVRKATQSRRAAEPSRQDQSV
ncbi:MAG TPA: hypothetical protein VMV17_10995 [Streptosporangiaceae bacterium]|nr:hypothetical protein [Streptosporangiaceae bacterium]